MTTKYLNIYTLTMALVILIALQSFNSAYLLNNNYSGTAYDLRNSATVFYSEAHTELIVNNKLEETVIRYKDRDQKTIGEKKLNYRKNSSKPDFVMEDKRTGYMEGAETVGSTIKVFYREKSGSEVQTKILSVPAPAVVDGGFNYFVKENFEKLNSNERVTFNFVVPERLDFYSFRISKVKTSTFQGKATMVLKMEADSYFLRQLMAPIMLTYDLSSKRLIQYEGISNISNDDGDRYVVKIVYPQMGP